jgi:hypothetical protein
VGVAGAEEEGVAGVAGAAVVEVAVVEVEVEVEVEVVVVGAEAGDTAAGPYPAV